MKEAFIVGLDGRYQEPVIVPDEQAGATPLYAAPEPAGDGEEPAKLEIIGYTIAERAPEGLYQPRWDLAGGEWIEGLTQAEIDAIRNAPQPITPEQRIDQLESDNAMLLLELVDTQLRQDKSEQDQADLLFQLVEGGIL